METMVPDSNSSILLDELTTLPDVVQSDTTIRLILQRMETLHRKGYFGFYRLNPCEIFLGELMGLLATYDPPGGRSTTDDLLNRGRLLLRCYEKFYSNLTSFSFLSPDIHDDVLEVDMKLADIESKILDGLDKDIDRFDNIRTRDAETIQRVTHIPWRAWTDQIVAGRQNLQAYINLYKDFCRGHQDGVISAAHRARDRSFHRDGVIIATHVALHRVPSTHSGNHSQLHLVPSTHLGSHAMLDLIQYPWSHSQLHPVPSTHPGNHSQLHPVPSTHSGSHVILFQHPTGVEEQPLSNRPRLPETFLGITSQAALAMLGISISGSTSFSQNAKILFWSAAACNVIGFLLCLFSMFLSGRRTGVAPRIVTGTGFVFTAYGFLAIMGMLLSDNIMLWVTGLACIACFPALVSAFMK